MAEVFSVLVKLIRVCFFIVSVLVPYLCTMTTNIVLLNDTVTAHNELWSTVRSPIGAYRMPNYNYTAINKMSNFNPPLIKLRRISSGRNRQRKIDTYLTPPKSSFVATSFHENPHQPESSSHPVQHYSSVHSTMQIHENKEKPQQNYNQNNLQSADIMTPFQYGVPPPFSADYTPHKPPHHYGEVEHEEHEEYEEKEESPEVEDKVFSKTIVATKALKIGKIVFSFFLVLVVIVLAILSSFGANLTPIVLPLALLPVGIIALLLFIPLLFAFVPLVVAGAAGGKKRRRRRFIDEVDNGMIQSLESRITQALDHWPAFLLSLTLQKYKKFSSN